MTRARTAWKATSSWLMIQSSASQERPDAAQVTVMVKRLDVPTMARYREGRRAEWKLIYAGTFGRRASRSTP